MKGSKVGTKVGRKAELKPAKGGVQIVINDAIQNFYSSLGKREWTQSDHPERCKLLTDIFLKHKDTVDYKKRLEHCIRVAKSLCDNVFSVRMINLGLMHHLPVDEINNILYVQDKAILDLLKGLDEELKLLENLTIMRSYIRDFRKLETHNWGKDKYDDEAIKSSCSLIQANIMKLIKKDIRPLIILMASAIDWLKHLEPIEFEEEEKHVVVIRSFFFFSPILHFLNLKSFIDDLEEHAYKLIEPSVHEKLNKTVGDKNELEDILIRIHDELIKDLDRIIGKNEYSIRKRVKAFYSTFRSLEKSKAELPDDLLGIRIIVNNIDEVDLARNICLTKRCIEPNGYCDYFKNPSGEFNYKALHLKQRTKEDYPLEIQIRTIDEHRKAEAGEASHPKYKFKNMPPIINENDTLSILWHDWFEEWVKFFNNHVVVLTSEGQVITLRETATPLHVIDRLSIFDPMAQYDVQIDGERAQITDLLLSGQRLKITKTLADTVVCRAAWLTYDISMKMKKTIADAFNKAGHNQLIIDEGYDLFKNYICSKKSYYLEFLHKLMQYAMEYEGQTYEQLFESIALGEYQRLKTIGDYAINALIGYIDKLVLNAHKIFNSGLVDCYMGIKDHSVLWGAPLRTKISFVKMKKDSDLPDQIALCQCCCPIPGEKICGITESYQSNQIMVIHNNDCQVVLRLKKEIVDLDWKYPLNYSFPLGIEIYSYERLNLLGDIGNTMGSELQMTLDRCVNYWFLPNILVMIHIGVLINNIDDIKRIYESMDKIDGIIATKKSCYPQKIYPDKFIIRLDDEV